jgi:hypothetical protein
VEDTLMNWPKPCFFINGVIILPVTDLVLPFLLSLAWRKNNLSPLLANFVELVRQLPEVKAFGKRRVS